MRGEGGRYSKPGQHQRRKSAAFSEYSAKKMHTMLCTVLYDQQRNGTCNLKAQQIFITFKGIIIHAVWHLYESVRLVGI